MIRINVEENTTATCEPGARTSVGRRTGGLSLASNFVSYMVRGFAHYYREKSMMFLESKSLIWYVKSIAAARKAFIGTVALSSLILVLFTGFVLIHLGLFFLLPWTLTARATLMLILGAVYFLAALGVLVTISSEKFFMRKSKASEMVDRFVKKQKERSQL